MGFNKRKIEDARRQEAEKVAASRRATERQLLEDAEQLVTAWNERQAKRMPMLFSLTIGAAITAGYWFLRANATIRTGAPRHPRQLV
jgi:type VI protein secretion system component VasF